MHQPPCLYNHLPVKIHDDGSIGWLNAGSIQYTDPFFDETIGRMRCLEENHPHKRITTSLDVMRDSSAGLKHIKPTAIIFHVSRCGSTLLSQLLGLDERNIVLAEVPFFDDLLRSAFRDTAHDLAHLLPFAVPYYSQRRTGKEEQLFIKADSWHLFFYEDWRKHYPGVPFILLYRRPDEVIHSQMKKKGLHAVPGMIEKAIFKWGKLPGIDNGQENYMAAVLEQYYTQMLHIIKEDALAFPFDYRCGVEKIVQELLFVCGISLNDAQKRLIQQRAKYDAKEPEKIFNAGPLALTTESRHLQNVLNKYHLLVTYKKNEQVLV